MIVTKEAFYSAMAGDATLITLLGGVPPYSNGRVPEQAEIATTPVISFHGMATPECGGKEDQYVVVDVWGMSGDLVEGVAERLRFLFHVRTVSGQWEKLAVASGRAFVRLDSEDDLPDPSTDVVHKVMRFKVLFASV